MSSRERFSDNIEEEVAHEEGVRPIRRDLKRVPLQHKLASSSIFVLHLICSATDTGTHTLRTPSQLGRGPQYPRRTAQVAPNSPNAKTPFITSGTPLDPRDIFHSQTKHFKP